MRLSRSRCILCFLSLLIIQGALWQIFATLPSASLMDQGHRFHVQFQKIEARAAGLRTVSGLRNAKTAVQASQWLLQTARFEKATLAVVQVGGCDGAFESTNDPMQELLRDPRVRAVVLEPVPRLWQELRQRLHALPAGEERLLAVNAAMCLEEEKAAPFFVVSERYGKDHPEAPHWAQRQIGSFKRSHIEKHQIPDEYIEIIQVPCVTPAKLLQRSDSPVGTELERIDALIVDAEGLDDVLVRAFLDYHAFSPALLIFESQHLSKSKLAEVHRRLEERHYIHFKDRQQTVAVFVDTWFEMYNTSSSKAAGSRATTSLDIANILRGI